MTSSFRSSDQGYVENESDDDDASFSTPPEEVEAGSSGKREKTGRTFNPAVLEKLLETSREQNQQSLLPNRSRKPSNIKQGSLVPKVEKDLQENDFTAANIPDQHEADVEPRYVPRGIRRSQSDADGRYKSRGLYSRQFTVPDDRRQRTGSADAFSTSPNAGKERVKFELDRLSAASTTTLVIQDESGTVNGNHVTTERTDQKRVPVMGTIAQNKYRRTFSPARNKTVVKTSPDQNGITLNSSSSSGSSSTISPVERSTQPLIASPQLHQGVPENTQPSSSRKIDTSPKKGILKSSVKEHIELSNETSIETKPQILIGNDNKSKLDISAHVTQKSQTNISDSFKSEAKSVHATPSTEINIHATPKSEIIHATQKPEISIHTAPKSEINVCATSADTHEVPTCAISPFIPVCKANIEREISQGSLSQVPKTSSDPNVIDINTKSISTEEKLDTSKNTNINLHMDLPLIHGLEIGIHKVHTFSGHSLSDFLKEQSKVNRKNQSSVISKGKQNKSSKSSVKKKSGKHEDSGSKKSESRLDKKENIDHATSSPLLVDNTVNKSVDESKFKVMVDKESQTSAWLINALIRKKTSKSKKLLTSFSKKKKPVRRGSTVSDTFIPTDIKRHKESFQRSSLGDLRIASSSEKGRTTAVERSLTLPSRISRVSSEKRIPIHAKGRRYAVEDIRPQLLVPGSSTKSSTDNKNDEFSLLPKPKKLSLTAVILLKNRLAKYRERKRNEKASDEILEDEPSVHRVSSDTLITIENELNLSKFEISKETDIIDDDVYEPEFSLGYTRKQLRFEHLPIEPMQGEEPLPPLPHPTSRRMRQRRESTLRERKRKCVQYCKKFIAFLFSHIGLCSLVVAYTILGGFIFQALENQAEYTVRSTIRKKRETVVGQLVSLAAQFQKTEQGMENFTGEINNTILEYQVFIHRTTKDKGWDGVEGVDQEGLWTFASSLLYAITVTTTIGYGHVAPKTPEGRIVTIGYAVVGIPLTLLCLTNIGDVMATGFRLLYGKICCGVCCTLFKPRRRRLQVDLEKGQGGPVVTAEEEQHDKPKEVIHVPTSLCLLLIAGYIFAGAMLFSMWENWDILTGSYFCFITLSTIGFGDIVPGMESNAWAAEEKLVLCALYLVLGLSLIAMCFNLVQEDVKAKCRWLGMKLGIVDKHETSI